MDDDERPSSLEEPLIQVDRADLGDSIEIPVPEDGGPDDVACGEVAQDAPGDRPAKSRNIPLTLAYTAVAYAGRSLWSQAVLPAFVFLMCNDNPEYVGFITAVMGVFTLLASFPSGMIADNHRRDAMLKAASVVGVAAIVATCAASYMEKFVMLGGALAIWGLYWGMSDASLSALFADSIRDGDRSHYFTQRYVLVKVGTLAGPIVALIMFAVLGNNWTVRDCAVVMVAGQALSLPAVMLLCFFSDDYVVPHDEDDNYEDPDETPLLRPAGRSDASSRIALGETQATSIESSSSEDASDDLRSDGNADGETRGALRLSRFCLCIPRRRAVPVLVATADFSAGLAAGMSIRYFPIFFLDNLKLSPIAVQVLYTLSPLGQAFLTDAAQRLSKRLGRPQTTVLFKWTGIALMVTMITAYTHGAPVLVICAIFLVRDSFMNSTQALNKSLLMDSVPREERGKWSALESVNMFSWSGSAAIGGILVGSEGIIFNFYVTAFLQFVATLPLVALFREVSIEACPVEDEGELLRQRKRRGKASDEDMMNQILEQGRRDHRLEDE